MRKPITISTVAAVAIAGAAMLFAGVTAPRTNATSSLCHKAKPSITVPATVTARTKVAITGSVGGAPAHDVTATLQSRLSTSKKWVNAASGKLSGGGYSLNWKAPAKKGTYKLRVRIAHASASNLSTVQTVAVN
jgi:hypothetical protein